jgi:hypothetical protein
MHKRGELDMMTDRDPDDMLRIYTEAY